MSSEKSCNCPYKKSCHSMRQELQVEIREKYKTTIEQCPFHKVLKPMYEKNSQNKGCEN